jgi:transcriptional regulator with XRE-family HTH domain
MHARFDWNHFWTTVREARRSRNLSQRQVGEEFRVGGSAVGYWERKKPAVYGGKFLSLCFIFDLDPYAFYTIEKGAAWQQPKLIDVSHEAQSWPEDFQMPPRVNGEYFADDNPDGYPSEDDDNHGEEVLDHDYSDQLNEDFLDDMEAY